MLKSNLLKFIQKINTKPSGNRDTLQIHLLRILGIKDKIKMYNVLIYMDTEFKLQIINIQKSETIDSDKKPYFISKIKKIQAVLNIDLSQVLSSHTTNLSTDELMLLDDILIDTKELKEDELSVYTDLLKNIKDNLKGIKNKDAQNIAQHILNEFNDAMLMYEVGGKQAFIKALENNICKFDFIINDESVDKTVKSNFTRLRDLTLEMVDSAARGSFLAQGTTLLLN